MLTLVTKIDLEKIPETINTMPLDEFISKGMGDDGLDIDEISPIVIEANSLMEFVDKGTDILYNLEMYKKYGTDIHFYDCNKIKEYTNDIKTYDNTINNNTLNSMTNFIIDYYQKQIKELKAKAETPIEKEDKVEEDKDLTPEEKIANENDFLIGRSLTPEETFKLLNNNPYKIYTIRISRTTNGRPDYYDVIANHKDIAKKLFALDIEHGATDKYLMKDH